MELLNRSPQSGLGYRGVFSWKPCKVSEQHESPELGGEITGQLTSMAPPSPVDALS